MPSITKILVEFNPTPDNLLPALKKINHSFGFIGEGEAQEAARYFNVPPSKIFEVATFYDLIQTKKPSEITIQVCSSTSCATDGSYEVIREIENALRIKAGDEFNPRIKLEKISCLGHCGEGPVVIINGKTYFHVTKSGVHPIIAEYFS